MLAGFVLHHTLFMLLCSYKVEELVGQAEAPRPISYIVYVYWDYIIYVIGIVITIIIIIIINSRKPFVHRDLRYIIHCLCYYVLIRHTYTCLCMRRLDVGKSRYMYMILCYMILYHVFIICYYTILYCIRVV